MTSELIYEAKTLVSTAKERIKQYETFRDQLEEVKKAFQGVVQLDSELQGKGAEAIKHFYEAQIDVVDAWLGLIDTQVAFLKGIKGDTEDAKLGGDSVVHVPFVQDELSNAIKQSKSLVSQQQEEMKTILSDIQDLVSIDVYSIDTFEDHIEKAEKERNETVQKVGELDQQWLQEYAVSENNQGLVVQLFGALMNATRKGGVVSPMYFDEKAYHESEIYQLKEDVERATETYLKAKDEQAEVRELQKKAEEEANKPWYEKTWDTVCIFTGELTGYYDYKRANEGIDPITGEKLSTAQRVTAGGLALAGFIPIVGWGGRLVKGGNAIYKTAKGVNTATHALNAYKTTQSFNILQKTEMGIYGLATANGFSEYITGYDMFGNELTKEQREQSINECDYWIRGRRNGLYLRPNGDQTNNGT